MQQFIIITHAKNCTSVLLCRLNAFKNGVMCIRIELYKKIPNKIWEAEKITPLKSTKILSTTTHILFRR
jgi:hypothetical protein